MGFPRTPEQDVYKAITHIEDQVISFLDQYQKIIKQAMDLILHAYYEKNKELINVKGYDRFISGQDLDGEDKKIYDKLQKMHNKISEANQEMRQSQETLKVMSGQGPIDERVVEAYDNVLKNVNTLNKTFADVAQVQDENAALLTGDLKIGEKGSANYLKVKSAAEVLVKNLDPIYKQTKELKDSISLKRQELVNAQKPAKEQEEPRLMSRPRPRPGKGSSEG